MTTKEFIRRSDSFHTLDLAAKLFQECHYSWIYKIDISHQNSHCIVYSDSVQFIDNLSLVGDDYVIIECFTLQAFEIQFKFYESFIHRLSSYQLDVLLKSGKVDNLNKYCKCAGTE